MAHKKGQGSSRNGRDSNSQRLGVKAHDGNLVSGGTITTGNDPDVEPRTEGITMVGADPDEGVPYKAPDREPHEHGIPKHCLTS